MPSWILKNETWRIDTNKLLKMKVGVRIQKTRIGSRWGWPIYDYYVSSKINVTITDEHYTAAPLLLISPKKLGFLGGGSFEFLGLYFDIFELLLTYKEVEILCYKFSLFIKFKMETYLRIMSIKLLKLIYISHKFLS